MAKVTLTDLSNLTNEATAVAAINQNNTALETALEKTLSRDGTSPNTMSAELDMNSQRIINLPAPQSATEPVRLTDVAAASLSTYTASPGTGTRLRLMTEKFNDAISVKDYGTDYAAIIAAKADAILYDRALLFTDGTYTLGTNTLELGVDNLKVIAGGANVILTYTGTGRAVSFDGTSQPGGSAYDIVFGGPNAFRVDGGTSATDVVYVKNVHNSEFKVNSRNGSCPFRTTISVCNRYEIVSSANEEVFTTSPTGGCHFDQQYCCEYYLIIEGVGGLDYATTFTNSGVCTVRGTVEGNPAGGFRLDSSCYGFTLLNLDCEVNGTAYDFNLSGTRHHLMNCEGALTNVGSICGATYTTWTGCRIAGLNIQVGATKNTLINCELTATPSAVGFVDSATTTVRMNCNGATDIVPATKSETSRITNDAAQVGQVAVVWSASDTGYNGLKTTSTNFLFTPTTGNLAVTSLTATLSACTGLPISTGVSGLGAGIATFLATPSSANLASAITNETGTGLLVFNDTPTFATGIIIDSTNGGFQILRRAAATKVTYGISNGIIGDALNDFIIVPQSLGSAALRITEATGALTLANSVKSVHATAGVGYGTGAGSTVTQATSKSTGVTLNFASGQITLHNASLAANSAVGFLFTNSAIAATDVVVVNIKSGATSDSYVVIVDQVNAGSCRISLRNHTAGALAEAVVLQYAVIKGSNS